MKRSNPVNQDIHEPKSKFKTHKIDIYKYISLKDLKKVGDDVYVYGVSVVISLSNLFNYCHNIGCYWLLFNKAYNQGIG